MGETLVVIKSRELNAGEIGATISRTWVLRRRESGDESTTQTSPDAAQLPVIRPLKDTDQPSSP